MKKNYLRRKISAMLIFGVLFLMTVSAMTVHAAVNPLAKMRTKDSTVLHGMVGYGDDFLTPSYSSKVVIHVTSSNSKVASVKGHSYKALNDYFDKKSGYYYYAGYQITPLSPGTTKIKATVTINKKTYTKVCTYRVYKWENPFKSIKIGSLDCKPLLQKSGNLGLKRKTLSGRFTYKLNSDFTLISAYATYYPDLKKSYLIKSMALKNGQTLPKNTICISMKAKSKKTKQEKYLTTIRALSAYN